MNKLHKVLGVCILGLGGSFSAQAFEGLKVSVGEGQNSTDTYRLALLSDFGQTFFNGHIKQHWEFGFSYWESDTGPNREMEVLSDTRIADKKLGQHFQFDDRLGLGVRFGHQKRHDVALSARHVSNAGLDNDNDGFDIFSLTYGYRF